MLFTITSNDLGYGGIHHGTFTTDEQGLKEIHSLLEQCTTHITDDDLLDRLEQQLETIDELLDIFR